MFATGMSLVLPMCILISCSSVLYALMALCMFMFGKVMSSLISVMSPPPCLCSLFVRMMVYFCCLAFCVSFNSCIMMMSGLVLCTRYFSSSIFF